MDIIHFNFISTIEHTIIGTTDKYFMNNEFSWRHSAKQYILRYAVFKYYNL